MTPDTRPNDLLLVSAKILCVLLQIAMAAGALALLIATPALIIFRSRVMEEFAASAQANHLELPLMQLAGVMAIGLIIVALLFVFFGKLRKIIDTVGDGDPFAPANADRLGLMAWLMLAVQLCIIPATALGLQLAKYADELDQLSLSVDSGPDLTGILLVVILFILARVFRHGTQMREDLEGTI